MTATKQTLTADTPVGTFTRTTARTYTHVVLSQFSVDRDWACEWCGSAELAVKKPSYTRGWRNHDGLIYSDVRIWPLA